MAKVKIRGYLSSHLLPEYKDSEDFVFVLGYRINQLCNERLAVLKERANGNSCVEIRYDRIDEEGAALITAIFSARLGLKHTKTSVGNQVHAGCGFVSCIFTNRIMDYIYHTLTWPDVNIEIFRSKTFPSKTRYHPESPSSLYRELLDDLQNGADSMADLEIVCAGGEKVLAHSLVLKLRSQYFKTMLLQGFRESKEGIKLPHSKEEIQLVVQFLYTGRLEEAAMLDLDTLFPLLSVAHEYQITTLEAHCMDLIEEYLLEKKLTQEQALELINTMALCDVKDNIFLIPALKVLNLSENEWLANILKRGMVSSWILPDLLCIAVRQSFTKLEQLLVETITNRLTANK